MLGIRSTFHTKPYIDWLDDGSLDWYWESFANNLGFLSWLLCLEWPKLLPIAERYPHLKVLIPHMGCSLDSRGTDAFATLDDLLCLARYPEISVMVSAAPCYSNDHIHSADLQPFI